MSEWRNAELGEFVEIQTGPFGSLLHAADYVLEGIPSIMPVNIGNRLNINREKIVCITVGDANRLKKYLVTENDIIYSRRGDVEKCALITSKESGWLCGTGCLRVRIISELLDPKFCAYYLSMDEIKAWVTSNAVGTTMPNLNSSILKKLPLVLPPLPEQQAIASVLSALDDKIDLLQRQNQTLEQMAATLFRQWFIEEAKEDWEEVVLSSFGEVVCGKTPSKKVAEYYGNDIPFLKIPDMHGKIFIRKTEDNLSILGSKSQIKKLIPENSINVSCIATVGLVCINDLPLHTNQQINSIIPKDLNYLYFLFFTMKNMYEELHNLASGGTATLNLNTGDFSKIKVNLPDEMRLSQFNERVVPIFDKIKLNTYQIQTLKSQRDILLPKLISGEVRLKGFETVS